MARTAVNLFGNCLATAVVARWEGVELGVKNESGEGPSDGGGSNGSLRRGDLTPASPERETVYTASQVTDHTGGGLTVYFSPEAAAEGQVVS